MKLIKTRIRTTLADERLSDLCVLSIERDFQMDYEQVIDQFSINHNNSRIMLRLAEQVGATPPPPKKIENMRKFSAKILNCFCGILNISLEILAKIRFLSIFPHFSEKKTNKTTFFNKISQKVEKFSTISSVTA